MAAKGGEGALKEVSILERVGSPCPPTLDTLWRTRPQLVFCLDSAGVVISSNEVALERFARGDNGLLGKPLLSRVHADSRFEFTSALVYCQERERWVDWSFRAVIGPGDEPRILATTYATRDACGRQVLLLVGRELNEHPSEAQSNASLEPSIVGSACKACMENFVSACDSCRAEMGLELVLAKEAARRSIAADIHDGLGQDLVTMQLRLARLQDEVSDDLKEKIEGVRALLRGALKAARSLTFEISNPFLHDLGLEAALRSLGERLAEDFGVAVEIEVKADSLNLRHESDVLLYRIVSELMINAGKHARAQKLSMVLCRDDDILRVVVEDDGVGFALAEPSELDVGCKGIGIFLTTRWVRRLGGSFQIGIRDQGGTRAVVEIPLTI
jgi:signal transduction histidine kinase